MKLGSEKLKPIASPGKDFMGGVVLDSISGISYLLVRTPLGMGSFGIVYYANWKQNIASKEDIPVAVYLKLQSSARLKMSIKLQ